VTFYVGNGLETEPSRPGSHDLTKGDWEWHCRIQLRMTAVSAEGWSSWTRCPASSMECAILFGIDRCSGNIDFAVSRFDLIGEPLVSLGYLAVERSADVCSRRDFGGCCRLAGHVAVKLISAVATVPPFDRVLCPSPVHAGVGNGLFGREWCTPFAHVFGRVGVP
jgi:hypothetical protein